MVFNPTLGLEEDRVSDSGQQHDGRVGRDGHAWQEEGEGGHKYGYLWIHLS